jgi:hypothetical protein
MAVLPVLRSPMISSRCPRPIGIMLSIALMPVCSGSFTGWRSAMPGAMISSGRRCGDWIGPLPSSGRASGSTTRPTQRRRRPARSAAGRWCGPLRLLDRMRGSRPARPQPTEFSSRLKTTPTRRWRTRASRRPSPWTGRRPGDAVTDLEHAADFGDVELGLVLADFLFDDAGDFVCLELHALALRCGRRRRGRRRCLPPSLGGVATPRASRVRTARAPPARTTRRCRRTELS